MQDTTHSICSEEWDINWGAVFEYTYEQFLFKREQPPLAEGILIIVLPRVYSKIEHDQATGIVADAVKTGELRKTDEGYEIIDGGPDTEEIRRRFETSLREMMRQQRRRVIQSPTSSGKTYASSTTEWQNHPNITGGQPVIVFSETTDAREYAKKKSQNSSATYRILRGRDDTCPLARGDYDTNNNNGHTPISAPDGSEPSEWFDARCGDRGLPASVAHGMFARRHKNSLPCSACELETQWRGVPRDSDGEFDYDVLHATHPFMRVPQIIKGCNLIIDEQPDFTSDLADSTVKEMVTSYLDEIDASIGTWEQLATILTQDIGADPDVLREELEKPDRSWFLYGDDTHALAPGIVEAIVDAEERCHDRWVGTASYTYPNLNPTHDTPEQKVIIRIVINESCDIRLLQAVPDFSEARSVIGLDAHVTLPKWRGNTTQEIEKTVILDSDELHRWRRNERNLKIVQVGEEKYSWTNQGFSESKVNAFCKELREEYGSSFGTGITSKKFEDDLEECLVNAGAEVPETLHYGNQKSQETFDSEEVGLVAGCISPSSEQIKDWLALLERQATPRREVVDDYVGQEWVGQDWDIARAILKDIREHGVLQACGRYARSPQESDDSAVVYVMTEVIPSNYVDEKIENIDVLGPKQKQILTYVSDASEGASPSEIAGNLETSRKHIHKTLNKCHECSWMEVEEGDGPNDADIFHAERCPSGLVEL